MSPRSEGGAGRGRWVAAAAAAFLVLTLFACASSPSTPSARRPEAPGASASPLASTAILPAPPEEAPADVRAAWEALEVGDAATARRRLEELRGRGELGAAGHAAAGLLELLVGDAAGAEREFRAALSMREEFAPALYGMGLVSQERGDREAASGWFERALEADPSLTPADVGLEVVRLELARARIAEARRAEGQGRVQEAIESYRRAIELAPRLGGAYLDLAELLEERGRRDEAVAVLDRGRPVVYERPRLLAALGDLYLRLEEYAAARDLLGRARELAPGDAAIGRAFEEARSRYEAHSLPEEYRRLRTDPVIHREDLAAMVAIGLRRFLEGRGDGRGAIIVDVEDSWATDYIHEVVSWGVMDVFENHGFLPGLPVSRGMLANVAYEVLRATGLAEGASGPPIRDVPSQHVLYEPIQVVVGHGILEIDGRGRFGDLLADVDGEEAFQAIEKLRSLLRSRVEAPRRFDAPTDGAVGDGAGRPRR